MKKTLALILALTMAFCLAACGKTENTEETFTGSIPIGDGVADIDISGAAYGTYKIIDAGYDDLSEGKEVVCYYDENCDTPYIEVFSDPKNDMTLEEYTKALAEEHGDGYYLMLDDSGYYTTYWDEGGFFYCSCVTYEGNEKFYTVAYSAKTEELQLKDNLYMWVPTGYTEMDGVKDAVFCASYEESYAFPYFIVAKDDDSYEGTMEYYSFNAPLSLTEDKYNEWNENWTEENTKEFFNAIGFEIIKSLTVDSAAGTVYGYILDNQVVSDSYAAIAYVPVDDGDYKINLYCDEDMGVYPYLDVAIQSIHVKEDAEKTTTIDIGGELGEITFEGAAFGTYTKVEPTKDFIFDDTDLTLYEDLNSDTPYIAVYRFAKGDYTLETVAQEEADLYSNGYYQTYEHEKYGRCAYICTNGEVDGNFYYVDTEIIEDGDDFVEIDIYGKTEELKIGNTDVYAWVPVGYTSYMDDDYKAHDAYFAAGYNDDYYYPNMFVGKWTYSYDYLNWYLGDDFPDGLPFSEETFNETYKKYMTGEGDMNAYYESIGDKIMYNSYDDENITYDYNAGYYWLKNDKFEGVEAWFQIGDDWYVAWLESDLDPIPAYADTFLLSLHTK